jgi:[amino group carrier protein]-lysine/ornithine hydrolase
LSPKTLSPETLSPEELLIQTVSIPSVSGSEAQVAQCLVGAMREMGFSSAHLDEAGNGVGARGTGPVQVVLLGHIDTVPGDIPVRLEDGKLYGRGSVDAKGSFCTFVAAVSKLSSAALEKATFTCIGAVEEEAPSSKGANFVKTRYSPDFVLIGEPSGWDALTLGYKGRLVVHTTVEKDNFHSAGEGRSSGDLLIDFISSARIWADAWNAAQGEVGIFFQVQLTVQNLETHSDGLVQGSSATLGLRLPPALSPLEAESLLTEVGKGLEGLTLEFGGYETPYRGEKDNALTRALRVAIRSSGGNPRFKLKTGTSDMNVVAEHWTGPMVAYGPGDSSLDHTPNEHLELAEFERAVGVLTEALERLVGSWQ